MELLNYDPETGVFVWVKRSNPNVPAGSVAGTMNNGYVKISIDNKKYFAHRLAWMYVYGSYPKAELDHINRVRNDNRISNLREATPAENKQNLSVAKHNTSGVKGVNFHTYYGKWRAYVYINGKQVSCGYFSSVEEAIAARKEAKKKIHTFHGED
jgi:hypothetical protein